MTELYKKLKELEERYNIKEKELIDPMVYLKITFPKKYEDRLSFLEEFNDFGFEIIKEHFDSFTHYSTEMQTSLANKLKKIIDIKSNNLTKDYIFNENFDACIKRYNNNITTYIDHNEPDLKDNKMFNYYKNTFELEKRILNTDFKTDYCNEIIKILKDCTKYDNLLPKFETKDVLKSLVFEIYTTFEKLYYKNILDSHSLHYPYLYMFDIKDNYKTIRDLNDKKYDLGLEKYVKKSLENKFEGLNSIKNTKEFKEMLSFNSELDLFQLSKEDGDNFNSYICKETINYRDQKLIDALIGVIYKTVIEASGLKMARELNNMFTELNDADKIKIAFEEYINDRIDLNDNQNIINLISAEKPLYIGSENTKKKLSIK